MTATPFPAGFLWGTATSSYQIEGAFDADGRGLSIWDRFSHTPGKTLGGHGDVACDHYHRWPEDLDLMAQLGVKGYRFSIAWPRILPDGRGRVNQAGLDFYKRLVEGMLERGITPFATLYHWDLPVALEDAGGWPARATAEAFAEYAGVVTAALGDRVQQWMTINEPWCISLLSYQLGVHAPGRKEWPAALAASHHVLLAHGLAMREIRRNVPGAQAGIVLNYEYAMPASASPADRDLQRWRDGYFNRWFTDAVYGRGYPADMVADYVAAGHLPDGLSFVRPGDMALVAAPTDFLGVNYYTRAIARADTPDNLPQTLFPQPPEEQTAMGWDIYPEGLYRLLLRLHSHYEVPKIYITENGVSYLDPVDADGRVRDPRRIAYMRDHFAACQRAIAAGVPLAGFFAWSFMDNFEWDRGYTQRFGIVHVDYETQRRIPKESYHWFRELIARNALD